MFGSSPQNKELEVQYALVNAEKIIMGNSGSVDPNGLFYNKHVLSRKSSLVWDWYDFPGNDQNRINGLMQYLGIERVKKEFII
jgi:hypothetical protein